jgi:hypothetical protein
MDFVSLADVAPMTGEISAGEHDGFVFYFKLFEKHYIKKRGVLS